MMMEGKVIEVGKDCSLAKILLTLKKTDSIPRLRDCFRTLASRLGVPVLEEEVQLWELSEDPVVFEYALEELVGTWVERKKAGGDHPGPATLEDFLKVLDSVGLKAAAGTLRSELLVETRRREPPTSDFNFVFPRLPKRPMPSDTLAERGDGDTELHRAARSWDEARVRVLVLSNSADVNARNKQEETPLHAAARGEKFTEGGFSQKLAIIRILIGTEKIDIFARDKWRGYTFLHHLVEYGRVTPSQFHQVVKVLISNGEARLFNAPATVSKRTPFHIAVQWVEVEKGTLGLLQSHGVDLSSLDIFRDSALHFAVVGRRSKELLSLLVEFGVDYKRLGSSERSLLHVAAWEGNVGALKFFIRKGGLDVNGRDVFRKTPLHSAVREFGRKDEVEECIQILVENGADKSAKDTYRLTPLELAKKVWTSDVFDRGTSFQLLS